MSDIDSILNELEYKYPKWLVAGLAASPEIKNIEDALTSMAKTNKKASDGFGKAAKQADKLHNALGQTIDDFDEVTNTSKKLNKAHSELSKALGIAGSTVKDSAKQIFQGNTSAAVKEFTSGLSEAATNIKGFGGLALGGLSLFSSAISVAAEIIAKNNTSYTVLAQSGFRINDAFVGMSKAAIDANMSLSDFTDLAVKNAAVLAQWGPESAKDLGVLSKSIRYNSNLMGRFGFDVSEVNDYLTDYLQVQQHIGFLNKISQQQMNSGFKEFITDAAEFSNIIGYSRKDIIQTATKLADAPQWGFFIKSLGDSGIAVNNAFMKATNTISAIEGPKMGGKIGNLMQDLISYGAPLNEETRTLVMRLQATNPLLLKQIYAYSSNIRAGHDAADSTATMAKQLIAANSNFSELGAMQLQATGQLGDFGNDMNEADSNIKNFKDRVANAGGSFDDVVKSMKKIDDENAISAGTISEFNESMNAVKIAFESGFVEVLNANRENLLKMATVLGRDILPLFLRLGNFLSKYFGDGTTVDIVTPSGKTISGSKPASVDQMISQIIDKNEGGGKLVNDSGGLTKWGVSQKAHPYLDIANMTKEEAVQLYKDQYASSIVGFNNLSPQAQMMALDTAINQGPKFANTMVAASGGDINKMAMMRKQRYQSLATSNPGKYAQYLNGWENRVDQTVDMVGQYQSTGSVGGITSSDAATIANATTGVTSSATSGSSSTTDQQNLKVQEEQLTHLKMIAAQNQDIAYLMRRQVNATTNLSGTINQ